MRRRRSGRYRCDGGALSLVEERRKLGDLRDRLLPQAASREEVIAIDEVGLDRALQLAKRREDERAPIARLDVPEVFAEVAIAPANLEFVATICALHRRAATAY